MQIVLDFDQILYLGMAFSVAISLLLNKDMSNLPLLIILSNSWLLLNNQYLWHGEYYTSEGFRHLTTIVLAVYLWHKERDDTLYLLYSILSIALIIQYLCGLHKLLSDIDMDAWALMLNTVELAVFIYGFKSNDKNNTYYTFYR